MAVDSIELKLGRLMAKQRGEDVYECVVLFEKVLYLMSQSGAARRLVSLLVKKAAKIAPAWEVSPDKR